MFGKIQLVRLMIPVTMPTVVDAALARRSGGPTTITGLITARENFLSSAGASRKRQICKMLASFTLNKQQRNNNLK